VPYFAPVQRALDSSLIYAWHVNDTDITPESARPNEITLGANGATTADVQLTLTHKTNLFLNVSGAWTVNFSRGTGVNDPFKTGNL
jgi:hypothetical protein